MGQTIAAIDVGSNAIRMGIAKVESRNQIEFVQVFREPIRLGEDSFSRGKISTQNRKLVLETFKRFHELFDKNHVAGYRAVATSALRDAENGAEIISEINKQCRLKLEIIDGLEEARLIHKAVVRSRVVSTEQFLLADIGGGSVEIIVSKNSQIQFMQSLGAGTVRLLNKLDAGKNLKANMRAQIEKQLSKVHQPVKALLNTSNCEFVATGGNPRTLGRLRADVFNKTNRNKIKRSELEFLVDSFFGSTEKERMQRYQLGENRVDVILPASLILLTLMEMFDFAKIKFPPQGLKEGLIYDQIEKL